MHKRKIGRSLNTSPESEQGSVVVGSSTAITIVPANESRMYLSISNLTNKTVFIKFQAAAIDNIKQGEFVLPGGLWTMNTSTLYTGEVSVILASGGAQTVYFTEL